MQLNIIWCSYFLWTVFFLFNAWEVCSVSVVHLARKYSWHVENGSALLHSLFPTCSSNVGTLQGKAKDLLTYCSLKFDRQRFAQLALFDSTTFS